MKKQSNVVQYTASMEQQLVSLKKSRCKITGEITSWSILMEGHNGENWQSAGNNQWYEFSDNGLFYWEETHRDDNSIYLKDNNGRSH